VLLIKTLNYIKGLNNLIYLTPLFIYLYITYTIEYSVLLIKELTKINIKYFDNNKILYIFVLTN
jgi:hypothetical protein